MGNVAGEVALAVFIGGIVGAALLAAGAYGALTIHAKLREKHEGNA